MRIWRIGSNSPLRRLHQKSTTLLNDHDVECFEKNMRLVSVVLTDGCPAPGKPLSSILYTGMPVEVVSVFLLYSLFHAWQGT